MVIDDSTAPSLHIGAVTGRYALGDTARRLGVNVFACRLRSISRGGYVASAPVVGSVGDPITATFAPFGTLQGHIARHVYDGFAVSLDAGQGPELAARIDAFRGRVWSGVADRRAEKRFMPGEPRSVIRDSGGGLVPCLVVDYSVSGAAVSTETTPALDTPLTVGQVSGRVVRLFDVGFAVRFDEVQDADEVEHLLEAPQEWRDAVAVLRPMRIDTGEGEDLALAGASY